MKSLKNRIPRPVGWNARRDCAVVIPIIREQGQYAVLFERRAGSLKTQPGEICFPGGSMEPGESPWEAALRELSEELLIQPDQAEFLMACDYLEIPAGFSVYPFLAELKGYQGTFSEEETEEIIKIPLQWFFDHAPLHRTAKILTVPEEPFPYDLIPQGRDYRWREGRYEVLFYQYGDLVIWGMTAKMMKSCVDTLQEEGTWLENIFSFPAGYREWAFVTAPCMRPGQWA